MEPKKNPCNQCPFLKNSPLKLGSDRMKSIIEETVMTDRYFICHKTLKNKEKNRVCAGFIHLTDKERFGHNQSVRFIRALFKVPLKGKELVFDSIQEAIQYHEIK